MATGGQRGLDRLDIFWNPEQDEWDSAKAKARQLLRSILPDEAWSEMEEDSVIRVPGRRGTYLISPFSQTEIRNPVTGKCIGYACLQLSIPAPAYDRVVAEYLLIKNAEDVYWETANIFPRGGDEFGMAVLFLIALNVALLVNLLLSLP